MSVHGYEHLSFGTHRNQKRVVGPLKLELQGGCVTWSGCRDLIAIL